MSENVGFLREIVQTLIENSNDHSHAAKLVCRYFGDEFSLYGNGWFDDDELFGYREDSDGNKIESAEHHELYLQVQNILETLS